MYFLVANYFRYFAGIRLAHWSPRIVVITGSNGKTTALNLIEVQLGSMARYSHGANSSFGIPFDILGLKRSSYSIWEWPLFALRAPFAAWKKPFTEKVYVVEADCDRPGEGEFLSSLLKPEVTVWLSCARTHSVNFEKLVRTGNFTNIDDAIAYEFGCFLQHTSKVAIINGDNVLIKSQLLRTKAEIQEVREHDVKTYEIGIAGTNFVLAQHSFHLPYLLPKETSYALDASVRLAAYFNVTLRPNFLSFTMPPGRSSLLKGVKQTTIVDSSYNANASSVDVFLRMVAQLTGTKWLILGDMTEQGAQEREEHEKVARLVASMQFDRVVFVGPRLKKYTLPLVPGAISYENPREALNYLETELKGGEVLVFKGARFLEGIIEHLLADKADAAKLCRREAVWQKRRAQWGL